MIKNLAIMGHTTRGREVIELLEMMGGNNPFSINDGEVIGNKETSCYYISENTATRYISWDYIGPEEIDKYRIFTLEEFLEKYPFKVGDKVNLNNKLCTVIWMCWECNNIYYLVQIQRTDGMYTKKVTVDDLKPYKVEDNMKTTVESTGYMQIGKTVAVIFNSENYEDEVELQLGDYEIEVRDGKTYAVKKKPVYPNSWEESMVCLNDKGPLCSYKQKLMVDFQKLIICRNAYWKIAGEQMGLNKPWEPDWTSGKPLYCITVSRNTLGKGKWYTDNKILAFPTEEMQDTFYDNFKDLIEDCKELL